MLQTSGRSFWSGDAFAGK